MKLPRVGFLSWSDINGPSAFSGAPWSAREALERAGHEIIDINAGPFRLSAAKVTQKKLPMLASNRRFRGLAKSLVGPLLHTRKRALKRARQWSKIADAAILEARPDVIVGVKMSGPIAFLNTELPILYASDTTASLLYGTYGHRQGQGRSWKASMLEIESRTLQRADATVFWFRGLFERAVADHGADPSRLHVAHSGPNVLPSNEHEKPCRMFPTREDLRILFVGSDPVRKQLDLAVDTVKMLRQRGWNVTLFYVGPEHSCTATPEVTHVGRLRLDSTEDRAIHRGLLETCHVNFLPTRADMMPLSVNEASRFGMPSVVSDIGGLGEQVLDRTTGRVLAWNAPVREWADAIEWTIDSPERYQSLCEACHHRSVTEFTWDAWGATVSGILQKLKRA